MGLTRLQLVEPSSSPLSSHSNFDSSVFSRSSSLIYFYPLVFSFCECVCVTLANLRKKECERPAPPAGYEELTVVVGSVSPSQGVFIFIFLIDRREESKR